MIKHINIKNFAIIKNIEIDFYEGFSTITGETGAGKSIIIEAITMALGDRADRTFVRTGEERAIIQILVELQGEEHILYREISKEGRSLCKIDGEIVTLAQQREYSKQIADIHGQYSHQSLLDEENHINLVDSFMSEQIQPLKNDVSNLYKEYLSISKEYKSIITSKNSDEQQREFTKFQLSEVEKIDPQKDEDTLLNEEIKILENKEKISAEIDYSYSTLYENDKSILGDLMNITKSLESLHDIYEPSQELSSILLESYYNLESLSHTLRECKDTLPSSDVSLDELIDRLHSIEALKRKHGGTLENVFEFKEKSKLILSSSEDREEIISALLEKKKIAESKLKKASIVLSKKRQEISSLLELRITEELADLNFKEASLQIQFTQKNEYTEFGIDTVEFLIKTNKGDVFKPLTKVASGGEMSRVMLAFKNIVCKYDNIPTIVFDEIDAGISGQTANVVGKKLSEIGKSRQVIAITHLPQVAALGDIGYSIVKEEDEVSTFTTMIQLDEDSRIKEIARLLSGDEITDLSLENAKSLLNK